MSCDVSEPVKKVRHRILQDELRQGAERNNRQLVGERVEILVEGPSKSQTSRFTGRTRDHRIVHFPASHGEQCGALLELQIDAATAFSLSGHRPDPDSGPRS